MSGLGGVIARLEVEVDQEDGVGEVSVGQEERENSTGEGRGWVGDVEGDVEGFVIVERDASLGGEGGQEWGGRVEEVVVGVGEMEEGFGVRREAEFLAGKDGGEGEEAGDVGVDLGCVKGVGRAIEAV